MPRVDCLHGKVGVVVVLSTRSLLVEVLRMFDRVFVRFDCLHVLGTG